jgi:hypothetical protein
MATFTFNTTVPAANDAPRNDQPIMQTNNASTAGIIAVDHIGFNVPNGGYHTLLHQPNQIVGGQAAWNPTAGSGVPAAIAATKIAGVQQTFSMLYTPNSTGATADTQLFSLTGKGGISQLTGCFAFTDGWAWLGGILLQWGRITGLAGAWPTTPQTVTFKDRVAGAIPFANACFSVYVTFIGPTSSSTGDICINSISATNFVWQFTGSSSASFGGFYWAAIGN